MSAPIVGWSSIGTITLRSIFFGLGRSQRLYGAVEAPRFSAGVLHTSPDERTAFVAQVCKHCQWEVASGTSMSPGRVRCWRWRRCC
jgi:hypothetical protein